MSYIENIDYKTLATDLLLYQFKQSPTITGLAKSWAEPVQQISDALIDFTNNNGITNAYGETLDVIGSWFGIERDSRLDDQYRSVILGRASIEGTDGTTESYLQALRVLAGTDQATFFEVYPATVYGIVGKWNTGLVDEVDRLRLAGVEDRLCLAKDFKWQSYAKIGAEDDLLYTEVEDSYEVVVEGVTYDLYTTVVVDSSAFGTTTCYGWNVGHPEGEENPVFVVTKGASIVSGQLVDNEGNPLVDNNGNPFIYVEYTE